MMAVATERQRAGAAQGGDGGAGPFRRRPRLPVVSRRSRCRRTKTCASPKTASSWCAAASAATARRSISARRRCRAPRCGFRPARSASATRSAATGEKAQLIALCDAMVQSDRIRRRGRSQGGRAAACGDDRRSETASPRKPRRRGSISTRWCGVRADMTTVAELPAGFADKVLSAQSTFRSVMDAMARPGSVQRIAAVAGTPAAMMRGTAAIALTLFDHDTPIWLDRRMSATPDVAKWLKFHTSAPVVADSSIAALRWSAIPQNLPALDRFAFGSNEYPDRSTTLILQVESLTEGPRCRTARPRHRRHRGAARLDPAARSVRAAGHQRRAVSARHRCRAGP